MINRIDIKSFSYIYTCTLLCSSTIWKYKEKELRYTFQRILSGLTVGASYCSIQTKIVCWRTFYEIQDKKSWKNHSITLLKSTGNSQIHVYTNNMRIHDPLYILLYVHDISLLCVVMEAWRYCLLSLLCELPKPGWLLAARQTENIPQLLLAFNAHFWSSGYTFNLHFMLLGILKPIL